MLLRLCWLSWGTWTRVALALGEQSLERFKLSVRCQPRLQELLVLGLGADRRVKLKLPPPSATASKSLQWCKQMVQSILDKGPTVYKIGMTGNPLLRFYKLPSAESPSPGYRYEKDKFEFMYIVFAGATWDEAGLVESCLIDLHKGKPGNRNINPGGEGKQVYDPPFFTYFVFKSLLRPPPDAPRS